MNLAQGCIAVGNASGVGASLNLGGTANAVPLGDGAAGVTAVALPTAIPLAQGSLLVGGATSKAEALAVARGSVVRGDSSGYAAAYSAKAAGKVLTGNGTDATSISLGDLEEYRRNRCYVNFIKAPQVPIHAANTMAIVTAANSQQDFFTVNGFNFELSQGTANTELAATGLTPGTTGWLLPGDNTAADWMEMTRGITLGSAQSFVSGTDAFYLRCAFYIVTRANHTHLYMGFRTLTAYVDAKTNADHLLAYDDKVAIGISDNAGVLTRHVSLATTDTALNAAHAAAANGNIYAFEIGVAANRVATFKVGHATPAGTTAAQMEAGRVAAIADLATDATWAGTAFSVTTAVNFVPYIVWGMAGGAAISDTRLLSWDCGYTE
jgi:hypothetical protein